jgi:hypothetical protein
VKYDILNSKMIDIYSKTKINWNFFQKTIALYGKK